MAGDLSQYECAAYHAILRALALSPASWETEEFLTSLRMVLHISDEVHMEYRSQVSTDPDVTELRELQRAQGHLGMQPSLSAQHSMPVSPAPLGQPIMPTMSMDGGGACMAPPLSGQLPSGLIPQQSVSGAGTRSQYTGAAAGAGGLGAPMASFPASAGGASTATGRAAAGQRRAVANSIAVGRASSTAAAAATSTKASTGKKALAASKAKQNARFQTAVPQGVDILEHDLRGYVLERRVDDTSSWQQAVVVAYKREAAAQRLTLAYNLGEPNETFEHGVYLRKVKADVLWRFARPARQLKHDWEAVNARDAASGGGAGGRASAGAGAAAGGKKRKAATGAPYSKDAMQRAVTASLASRKVDDLKAMVMSIEEKRRSVVGQLALERVRDMLGSMSVSSAKEQLNRELDSVRRKRSALESNGGDVTAAADGAAAAGATATGVDVRAVGTGVTVTNADASASAEVAAGELPRQAAEGAAGGTVPLTAAGDALGDAGKPAPVGGGLQNGAANGVQPMEQDEETDVD